MNAQKDEEVGSSVWSKIDNEAEFMRCSSTGCEHALLLRSAEALRSLSESQHEGCPPLGHDSQFTLPRALPGSFLAGSGQGTSLSST